MNQINVELQLKQLIRLTLEMRWFVDNYRHNKMFRDGRVLGLI